MDLFALISLLIAMAALASYVNHRFIGWPTTIGVTLVALVGSIVLILAGPYAGGFRTHAASIVGQIDFDHLLLHGMLAFLLFAGSIHVDLGELFDEWLPVSLLAAAGTVISTVLVGTLTWGMLRWLGLPVTFMQAMLFGAIISPTDPIAVLGIMKSVGAPRRLEVQLAGESLFNDGLGVVLFLVLLDIGASGAGGAGTAQVEPGKVALLLVKEIGGAVLLGLATGLVACYLLRRVDQYQVEVLLTLALAMGVFALGDALHASAPIAVVVAGLVMGNRGRASMSRRTREHVDTFWELIDEILNVVLFLLIGLQLLVLPMERRWLAAAGLAIPLVLLARWISVGVIMLPVGRLTLQVRGAISILTWGGLRGGISIAMALSLPPSASRGLVIAMTYGAVMFSILVQGLTIGRVIRRIIPAPPAQPSPAQAEPHGG